MAACETEQVGSVGWDLTAYSGYIMPEKVQRPTACMKEII